MVTNNKDILTKPFAKWTEFDGAENIAISTRLRLARNLNRRPFPQRQTATDAKEVALEIKEAVYKLENTVPGGQKFNYYDLAALTALQRQVLFEKHFISRDLVQDHVGSEVVINDAQDLAIMINEEDHLRMQCILPGLQLAAGWEELSRFDDLLAGNLDFAYDEQLGFLTACPSNVGTGLRASVMLHLPALKMTNKLEALFQQLPKLGMTVRGVYGEGSGSYGNLYQISNQVSIGFSEQDIISRLQTVVEELMTQEQKAREWLLANNNHNLLDYIWRSYGVLKSARLLSGKEAMEKISIVRLGVDLGILDQITPAELNRLMVQAQPAFLVLSTGQELSPEERDWVRGEVVRSYFEASK